MRLIVTCNGPGETAGWLRPLLMSLYERAAESEVHVFFVPDDYATGSEPAFVRALFPQAHVYDSRTYVKVALGAAHDGLPTGAEIVLYLGGDLMHAARLHKRFGGAAMTYKFSTRRYARDAARAFAVDEANAGDLRESGIAPERITIVGNLAVDGALQEAKLPVEEGTPENGLLIMPGSRGSEVRHLVPFFFTAALWIRREAPSLPIAFAISPFTKSEDVRAAIEAGGDPRFFAHRGRMVHDGGRIYLETLDAGMRFPIVRNAMASAARARLALTIPGTKAIELAALGTPAIACTPLNVSEGIAFNGPLTYLDRLPLVGIPLKRTLATALSRRYRFHTQPNMDAQRELIAEMHGTLTPGRVARVVLERLSDETWLSESASSLRSLYRGHAGAAERMAGGLIAGVSSYA